MDATHKIVSMVTEAVRMRLGRDEPEVLEVVIREVCNALAEGGIIPPPSKPSAPAASHSTLAAPIAKPEVGERAIVTTSGKNRRGMVASIASAISEAGGDIQDISQTIVSGYFTMIMIVDLHEMVVPFEQFRKTVMDASTQLQIQASVVHENIFHAMQRV